MADCPVCHEVTGEVIFRVTPEEAAQQFVVAESDPHRYAELVDCIRRLWKQGHCVIRHCSHCSFSFADPFIAGDKEFYNLAYARPAHTIDKWSFQRTLSELSSQDRKIERVLEIGAGYGYFLDKIAGKLVPASSIHAIEYHDEKISRLRRQGYTVLDGGLPALTDEDPFDAIFMFAVVEHMDDLDGLFGKLARLLRPNGLLFITVPNAARIDFQECHGSLRDMPPNHIGRWSPEAFRTVGARHGVRLDKDEIEPFSLVAFAKKDTHYFYLLRSQDHGTIVNWSRSRRAKRFGKLLGKAVAGLNAPQRLPVWYEAWRTRGIGPTLWVMFHRDAPSVASSVQMEQPAAAKLRV